MTAWRRAVTAAALGAVVTLAHLILAAFMRAPIVMPDEGGYLDNARFLALGGPRPITNYYPGLSFLVAPAWWFSHDPLTVWRVALVVNCVACGLTAVVTLLLVRRLAPGALGAGWTLGIAAVVSCYPALLLYSSLALSESLFALGASLVVLVASALPQRGPHGWFALGALSGLLVCVHPRGAAVAVAVLVVGIATLVPWRSVVGRLCVAALVAGVTLGAGLTRAALIAVRPSPGTGLGAYQAAAVVGRVVAAHSLKGVATGAAGQVLYMTVATAGLAPLGIVVGMADLVGLGRGRPASSAVVARSVAALSSVGILAMSALFLNGGDRADQLVYGRYNEGAIVATLVIGITWLIGGGSAQLRRRCLDWLIVGAAGLLSGAIALEMGVAVDHLQAPLNPATVLALEPIFRRTGSIDPLALAGVGAIVLGGAVLLMLRWRAAALVVVAALFVFAAGDSYTSYLVPGSVARSRQDVLALTLSRMPGAVGVPRSCVAYDAGLDFTYFNDRFYLPGWELTPYDGAGADPPCGDLVISSRANFFAYHQGAQIVSAEDDVVQHLFVLAGPTERRLAAAGWLLPASLPGPLKMSVQQASVVGIKVPSAVHEGSSVGLRVRASDLKGSAWPNLRGLQTDRYAVRVVARWFRAGVAPALPGTLGPVPAATTTVELPRTLLPGQSADLMMRLAPRAADGSRLRPGEYTVQVAVYQELVGAIPGRVLTFPITVIP